MWAIVVDAGGAHTCISQALPFETDVELAQSILSRCRAAAMRFLPSHLVEAAADRFFVLTRSLATAPGALASMRTLCTRSMVSFAVTRSGGCCTLRLLVAV